MSLASTQNWSLPTMKRFLRILEKLPAIWNEYHAEYKHEVAKSKCFTVLVRLMNIPELDEITANKRFQSVRDSVLRLMRHIQPLNEEQKATELQKGYFPSAKFLVDMYKVKYKDGFSPNKVYKYAYKPKKPKDKDVLTDRRLLKKPEEWSVQHSRKLLSLVEQCPIIWKKDLTGTATRDLRTEAFQRISQQMGIEGFGPDLARKKYEDLRDTIYRKVRVTGQVDFTKGYFPAARFLIDYYTKQKPELVSKTPRSETVVEWDLEHSINMLKLIRNYPCIWKKDNEHYRNSKVRAQAFHRIAVRLNLPGYDRVKVYKKYESIRSRILYKSRRIETGTAKEREKIATELKRGFFPAASYLVEQYRQIAVAARDNANVDCDMDDTNSKSEPTVDMEETTPSVEPETLISNTSCRICLSPSDGTFKSMVKADNTSYGLKFEEIFQHTTNFIVTTDQPFFPAGLCESCEQDLLQCYVFKMKCEQTEDMLKNLYNCKNQQEANELVSNHVLVAEVQNNALQNLVDDDPMEEFKGEGYYFEAEHNYTGMDDVVIEKVGNDDEVVDCFSEAPLQIQPIQYDEEVEEDAEAVAGMLDRQITKQFDILEGSSTLVDYKQPIAWTPCEFCGEVLDSRGLAQHIKRNHSGDTPSSLQCDECEKCFKDIRTLRAHKKWKHSTEKEAFPCQYCDRIFSSLDGRRYHERSTHENGKKYNCWKCDKNFITELRLQRHMKCHDPDRRK